MPDPIEDLRSTEDAIEEDAKSIRSLEREKSDLDPTDPRVGELSDQVKRKATDLDAKAAAEQDLSAKVRRQP